MKHLKEFSSNELVIDKGQAMEILNFFFGSFRISREQLTNEDRGFAQALMVEAVDASNSMGKIETLFKSAASPNSSIIAVAKNIVRQSVTSWWKHGRKNEVVIFDSVKNTLSVNFKSVWAYRVQTGEFL